MLLNMNDIGFNITYYSYLSRLTNKVVENYPDAASSKNVF